MRAFHGLVSPLKADHLFHLPLCLSIGHTARQRKEMVGLGFGKVRVKNSNTVDGLENRGAQVGGAALESFSRLCYRG